MPEPAQPSKVKIELTPNSMFHCSTTIDLDFDGSSNGFAAFDAAASDRVVSRPAAFNPTRDQCYR